MKSSLLVLLGLAAAVCNCNGQQATVAAIAEPDPTESSWGRIYLRHGLSPIQYFRDAFGGPMTRHEVSFYFPKRHEDRFGCKSLPESEKLEIEAANRSAVLVVDRGECTFERKARLADDVGAAALVVVSPTDDVSAPIAALNDEDGGISIASVMIRRTAGDMLRVVAQHMTIYGRLIPMTCQRVPYTCEPRRGVEKDYMMSAPARSGSVFSVGVGKGEYDGTRRGSFLAATYGSVLPTIKSFPLVTPIDGTQACKDVKDDNSDGSTFAGKAVLIPAGDAEKCTEFEKVSNIQRHGASVVLLVQNENVTVMTHPGVEVSWHAYNITIPVLAVSSNTGVNLASLKDAHGDAASIRFALNNGVADAWELLAKHSQRSAWPKRLKRCSKTLAKLFAQLRGLGGDDEMEEALKNVFITVVGGSLQEWEKIANPDEEAAAAQGTPVGGTTHETVIQTVKKSEARDEL